MGVQASKEPWLPAPNHGFRNACSQLSQLSRHLQGISKDHRHRTWAGARRNAHVSASHIALLRWVVAAVGFDCKHRTDRATAVPGDAGGDAAWLAVLWVLMLCRRAGARRTTQCHQVVHQESGGCPPKVLGLGRHSCLQEQYHESKDKKNASILSRCCQWLQSRAAVCGGHRAYIQRG